MKKFKILFMLTLVLNNTYIVKGNNEDISVSAKGAVLISKDTGRVLWGKEEDIPLAMASTTKIMTAILVLEKSNLDDIVTISNNASNQPKVHMSLQEGEEWSVESLLYGLMLGSYNDTAVALAEHIGGSVENFCNMMTNKAIELGAINTVFGSPNGLDSHLEEDEHRSTPYELAIITSYALENSKFCEIIQTKDITISNLSNRQVNISNPNRLLSEFQGGIGVKTGYTNRAGHCFVGSAIRDNIINDSGEVNDSSQSNQNSNKENSNTESSNIENKLKNNISMKNTEDDTFISVVLASGWGDFGKEAKWVDTKNILNYAFENYYIYDILRANDYIDTINILNSPTREIDCILEKDFFQMLSYEELENLDFNINMTEELNAPVITGQNVGNISVLLEGEVLEVVNIITSNGAETFTLFQWFKNIAKYWVDWA